MASKEFANRMAKMAFHDELEILRWLRTPLKAAYQGAARVADDTYDLVMSEDRPAVLTRFRR